MPEAPQTGGIVGSKYRVLRKLGEGGMGAVYEAENTGTGKHVALKRLHPHLVAERSAVERFIREARLAARVHHPNVVDLYDIERDCDGPLLVMEYLEGESLAKYLERGPPPMVELLRLICGAMRGAAAAHKKGIVHRDIKPENIFLTQDADDGQRTPKVLDFGVSKLVTPESGEAKLTATGACFGTPRYMSYEQLAGRQLDARADVYSFGVLLYWSLTGQYPYDVSSFPQLIAKFVTAAPTPLRQHRQDLPEELERVVMKALEKDRDQRTPSLEVLIAELEPFMVAPTARSTKPFLLQTARRSAQRPPALLGRRPPPNFAHRANLARVPRLAPRARVRTNARPARLAMWVVIPALAGAMAGLWVLTFDAAQDARPPEPTRQVGAVQRAWSPSVVPPTVPHVTPPLSPATPREPTPRELTVAVHDEDAGQAPHDADAQVSAPRRSPWAKSARASAGRSAGASRPLGAARTAAAALPTQDAAAADTTGSDAATVDPAATDAAAQATTDGVAAAPEPDAATEPEPDAASEPAATAPQHLPTSP